MQRDEKRQQLRRVLIDMHAEQCGNEQRMPETAHGEEFGHALQHAQEDQKRQIHAAVLVRKMSGTARRTMNQPARQKAHRLCLGGKSAPSASATFGEILTRCVTTRYSCQRNENEKGRRPAAALSIV